MISRRHLLLAGLAAPVLPQAARATMKLGEDGLYHHDWFVDSFLDLGEDLAAASSKGKRFAVLWGLKGCAPCKTLHERHLSDAATVDYIRERFDIVHLNFIGSREVIDFDGQKRDEKAFSAHYGVRTTPVIQFFPKTADGFASLDPARREVVRMPGLLDPKSFLAMFRYVHEEGYKTISFPEWVKRSGS